MELKLRAHGAFGAIYATKAGKNLLIAYVKVIPASPRKPSVPKYLAIHSPFIQTILDVLSQETLSFVSATFSSSHIFRLVLIC